MKVQRECDSCQLNIDADDCVSACVIWTFKPLYVTSAHVDNDMAQCIGLPINISCLFSPLYTLNLSPSYIYKHTLSMQLA